MNYWARLIDKSCVFKAHVIHKDFAVVVAAYLYNKQLLLSSDERLANLVVEPFDNAHPIFLDEPGMVLAERSIREVGFSGLKVHIPSQDWATILASLKLLPPTTYRDTVFYIVEARFFCLVLSNSHRQAMIAGMEEQLQAAEAEAVVDNARFLAALQKAQSKGAAVVSARAKKLQDIASGKKGN